MDKNISNGLPTSLDGLLDGFENLLNDNVINEDGKEVLSDMIKSAKSFSDFYKAKFMTTMIESLFDKCDLDFADLDIDTNSTKDINSIAFCLLINDHEEKAFEFLNKILKKNINAPVHMSLGDMYYYGIGTERNLDFATKFYQDAINNNEINDSIIENMSDVFVNNAKETINRDKMYKFYDKAYKYGSIYAKLMIAEEKMKDKKSYELVFKEYEAAAIRGEEDLEYRPNYEKLNIANAFNSLGYLIVSNKDCDKYQDALKYFMKSASLGLPMAYYNIGQLYEYGVSVDVDLEEARKWYTYASNENCRDAEQALERLNSKTK